MRFGGRPEIVFLLWFAAPGLVGGLLAWMFGGALLEIVRTRSPRMYSLIRASLPLIVLIGVGVASSNFGKRFAAQQNGLGPEYEFVLFAPLLSAATGVGAGLLVALYELTPTAKSPLGEPLSSRPAKSVLLHGGLFLAAAVITGYLCLWLH